MTIDSLRTARAPSSLVQETASAKINLSLHVVGRRADGYHLLESLVAFTRDGDRVRIDDCDGDDSSLLIEGPFAEGLEADDRNLVMRAARAIGAAPCRIFLDKRLPIASGIGGGSADAAATLRGLMAREGRALSQDELDEIALSLGADVPVCLRSQTCFMGGIGENIQPAPALPQIAAVLINPLVGVSTAAVFQALGLVAGGSGKDPHPDLPRAWRDAAEVAAFVRTCRNDLEPAARAIAPVIGDVLDFLQAQRGCLTARMSGSGATCFGLFATLGEAERAVTQASVDRPRWWALASELR